MNVKEPVNILLVDDQPAKLLSYATILADLGENLVSASSGREALEHLLKKDIAVVLIDVVMPDLDGFELAAMIRDHPRFQSTAIIFVSAIAMIENAIRIRQLHPESSRVELARDITTDAMMRYQRFGATDAIDPLQRAVQLAPNPALIQVMLGQALVESNDPAHLGAREGNLRHSIGGGPTHALEPRSHGVR